MPETKSEERQPCDAPHFLSQHLGSMSSVCDGHGSCFTALPTSGKTSRKDVTARAPSKRKLFATWRRLPPRSVGGCVRNIIRSGRVCFTSASARTVECPGQTR
jgi:hypothetical protein